MTIPFVDIRRSQKDLESQIFVRIKKIVASSSYILGSDVAEFENDFATYLDARHCVGVASGTDALSISLQALGIGPGDEVIAPAMTFISTVTPIVQLGAKPVLVDILPDIPLADADEVEKSITARTKAIIAVHLHGHPVDMSAIMKIGRRHKIPVIEDACQAHGSEVYISETWKKAGTIGDAGCFSFYPSKNLGCWGDGGAIVTDSADIADYARRVRSHGQERKYYHTMIGMTSRLDTVQAVVLAAKLATLSQWNEMRRASAEIYREHLTATPLLLPQEKSFARTNYHIFQVRTKNRDKLNEFLATHGIACNYHYPYPVHVQPALSSLGYKKTEFPNASAFAKETLSLPMFPGLTKNEIKYIASVIKKFFRM